MDEKQAHDAVLKWCRAEGGQGLMRKAPENPIPGNEWKTRYRVFEARAWSPPIVAEGDTWAEVLANLPKCGECGEHWPCSDSKRRDLPPVILARHHRK